MGGADGLPESLVCPAGVVSNDADGLRDVILQSLLVGLACAILRFSSCSTVWGVTDGEVPLSQASIVAKISLSRSMRSARRKSSVPLSEADSCFHDGSLSAL